MADCVDPRIEEVEHAVCDERAQPLRAEAELQQLRAGHDAVLLEGERGEERRQEHQVTWLTWGLTIHIRMNQVSKVAPIASHVADGVRQVGHEFVPIL